MRRIIVPTYGIFTADLIRHLLHTDYPNMPFFTAHFYLYNLDHFHTFPYSLWRTIKKRKNSPDQSSFFLSHNTSAAAQVRCRVMP